MTLFNELISADVHIRELQLSAQSQPHCSLFGSTLDFSNVANNDI